MRDFIVQNISGRRYAELADLMSDRFGEVFTAAQIHAFASNHHLTNGMPTGAMPGECPKLFPDEIVTCTCEVCGRDFVASRKDTRRTTKARRASTRPDASADGSRREGSPTTISKSGRKS